MTDVFCDDDAVARYKMKIWKLPAYLVTLLVLSDLNYPALIPPRSSVINWLPGNFFNIYLDQLSYHGCTYFLNNLYSIGRPKFDVCFYLAKPMEIIDLFSYRSDRIKQLMKTYHKTLLHKPKLINYSMNSRTSLIYALSGILMLIGAYFHPVFIMISGTVIAIWRESFHIQMSSFLYVIFTLSILSCILEYYRYEWDISVMLRKKFRGRGNRLGR